MAPSPSVFLAAVAQRTKRLRLGPMIYAAPLYHPLRLLQEICMLDQMSAGRLEMGFGRGAAAAEIRFFDVDPAQTEKMYEEVVGFILEGLREGAVTVSEEGGRKRRIAVIAELAWAESGLCFCGVFRATSATKRRMRNPSGWCVSSNSSAPTFSSPTMPAMRARVSSSFSGSGDGGRNKPPWAERGRAGSAAR